MAVSGAQDLELVSFNVSLAVSDVPGADERRGSSLEGPVD